MSNDNNRTLRVVLVIAGFVVTICTALGAVLTSYYRSQREIDEKIATMKLEQQANHAEVMNELIEIGFQLKWNELSIDKLAQEIPRAIDVHEYKMHPKQYKSAGSPTEINVVLPEKPETMKE